MRKIANTLTSNKQNTKLKNKIRYAVYQARK